MGGLEAKSVVRRTSSRMDRAQQARPCPLGPPGCRGGVTITQRRRGGGAACGHRGPHPAVLRCKTGAAGRLGIQIRPAGPAGRSAGAAPNTACGRCLSPTQRERTLGRPLSGPVPQRSAAPVPQLGAARLGGRFEPSVTASAEVAESPRMKCSCESVRRCYESSHSAPPQGRPARPDDSRRPSLRTFVLPSTNPRSGGRNGRERPQGGLSKPDSASDNAILALFSR